MTTLNNVLAGATVALNNAAFVAGSTSTVTTTVDTKCFINGAWATVYSAAATQASPTLDWNTGLAFVALQPNQTCVLVWGINAAGVVKLCQGPIIATIPGVTTTVGALQYDPQFPPMPDDFCPHAYTIVRTAPSAAAWTPGTSSWTASGVSCTTFKNIAVMPNRPQAS